MRSSSDRGHVSTEQQNPTAAELDTLSIEDALAVMQTEDRRMLEAVENARPQIVRAVESISEVLLAGGRLIYVGAGTSGRLGLLDAVECPPTFHSDPGQVQAIMAGGEGAFLQAVEGAEDDTHSAREEIRRREVSRRDVVFGIAAGGTTPFVHAALAEARSRSAKTIFLACVPFEEAPDEADLSIRILTGPEVLAGSTRLKAGTATKLVLNAITTLSMARLGRVHGNQMVDLRVSNKKLRDRAERLVMQLAEVDRDRAAKLLDRAQERVKVAVVMQRRGVDAEQARELLRASNGFLRTAME